MLHSSTLESTAWTASDVGKATGSVANGYNSIIKKKEVVMDMKTVCHVWREA